MGNTNNQQIDARASSSDKADQVEYVRMNGAMVMVDKQDRNKDNANKNANSNNKQANSGLHRDQNGNQANEYDKLPAKLEQRLSFREDMAGGDDQYFTENYSPKLVQIYVDKDIEFAVDVGNEQLTCGWLLSEVTRRYTDALNKIRKEYEAQLAIQGAAPPSGVQKHKRKFIVALKSTDQRESLDYWLTQYDRPLHVLEEGDFLIAHFAKITATKAEVCGQDFDQIKVIGRGGFSRVILVRKKDTGRLYAMKIMKKEKIIREKKLKPILSERKVLEKLNHPFIIKLHWAFQSNEELFFVMDLCTGGEIFFHLNRLRKFAEPIAMFYFAEILLGVEFLHDKNVVYRDIKPENILIDIDGHIRIADFGLSKIIKKMQKSYSFCGSPEYMSPEMLQGSGHDRRVDIYCLGALLFEMLTGLPPFYNKDTNQMYENILNQELQYPDYLSAEVIELIDMLLQKDPTKRFQNISDVKKHAWLKDVQWSAILDKQIIPPIVPSVNDCHIDPDYVELPLDFEESKHKVRMSTERRFSYYYESTLQSRSFGEQSFYNNFFENKNESGSGIVNLLGGNSGSFNQRGSSVRSGVFQGSGSHAFAGVGANGLSIQSDLSHNSHDSAKLIGGQKSKQKNVIDGLDNFTFIDVPPDEADALKQLNKYVKAQKQRKEREQQEQQQQQQPGGGQEPRISGNVGAYALQNMNKVPGGGGRSSDKNHRQIINQKLLAANSESKNGKHSEEAKYSSPQGREFETSAKGGNFTQSNKSALTFEGSNNSIAQEHCRADESIATMFGSSPQNPNNTQNNNNNNNNQKTTIMLSSNNRLTIEEEDDDDMQSVGGSQVAHTFGNTNGKKKDNYMGTNSNVCTQASVTLKHKNNLQFQIQSDLANLSPSTHSNNNNVIENFMPVTTYKAGGLGVTNNSKFNNNSSSASHKVTSSVGGGASQSSHYQTTQTNNQNYRNQYNITTDNSQSQYQITGLGLDDQSPDSIGKGGLHGLYGNAHQFGRSGSQATNCNSSTGKQFINSQQALGQTKQGRALGHITGGQNNYSSVIERDLVSKDDIEGISPLQGLSTGNTQCFQMQQQAKKKGAPLPKSVEGTARKNASQQKKKGGIMQSISKKPTIDDWDNQAVNTNSGEQQQQQQPEYSMQKGSTTTTTMNHLNVSNGNTNQQLQQQEASISRIPSVNGIIWSPSNNASGRQSTNHQHKNTSDQQTFLQQQQQIAQNQMKKGMHNHKPSYSMSPSNIVQAHTIYGKQQSQNNPIKQLNSAVESKQSSIKNTPISKPVSKVQSSGINSFLKAAQPLQNNLVDKLPLVGNNQEDIDYFSVDQQQHQQQQQQQQQQSSNIFSPISNSSSCAASKKASQQNRSQKFRSMDMTQTLGAKKQGNSTGGSIAVKGLAVGGQTIGKTSMALKQQIQSIQTINSNQASERKPTANGVGIHHLRDKTLDQVANGVIISDNIGTGGLLSLHHHHQQPDNQLVFSNHHHHTPQNVLYQSQINDLQPNSRIVKDFNKTNPQNLKLKLDSSKTPERKQSIASVDQKSMMTSTRSSKNNYSSSNTLNNQLLTGLGGTMGVTIDMSRRQLDSSSSATKHGHQDSQSAHTLPSLTSSSLQQSGKITIPKGQADSTPMSKGSTTVIKQQQVGLRPPQKQVTLVKGTGSGTGVSRNDANQKKSNTTQNTLIKKSKNL